MSLLKKDFSAEPASTGSAVKWFIRLQDVDSPPLELEELQQWEQFAADPSNRQRLAEAKAAWEAAQALGGPKMPSETELDADHYDGSISVSEWLARTQIKNGVKGKPLRRFAKVMLLAAGLATAALGLTYYRVITSSQEQSQAFATLTGERRVVKLVDGSTLTLGARTAVQARITKMERAIVLKHGEAWFDVSRDRNRVFRVLAGRGVITVLGTEFNVRRDVVADLDRVTVTVGAGAVKVEPSSPTEAEVGQGIRGGRTWESAELVNGQEISYDGGGERGEVRGVDIEVTAAWKEGRLEYIHEPLKAVVARVNRYSAKPIQLSSDAIGELDFSGTVFEGQVEDWLHALQTAFPVSVKEEETRILIEPRAMPGR